MKKLLVALMLMLLSGCASTTPASHFTENGRPLGTHNMPWSKRQAQLASIDNWTAQGNIAAHSDQKGWNASFNWHQEANKYTLALFGPLGVDRTELTGSPGQVTLTSGSRTITASSPEILLQQQTGWNLPVSDLYYWLRGLPAPKGHYARSFDMNNHIVHLRQDGWDIRYLRYLSINGVDLPDRLLLINSTFQVRIVITQWHINS
jgi:outer membrane lipoprotein LolB